MEMQACEEWIERNKKEKWTRVRSFVTFDKKQSVKKGGSSYGCRKDVGRGENRSKESVKKSIGAVC